MLRVACDKLGLILIVGLVSAAWTKGEEVQLGEAESVVVRELSLVFPGGGLPEDECFSADEFVRIDVLLGAGSPVVVGGQFNIAYSPTCMEFVSALPGHTCDGDSPFSNTILLSVDGILGRLFYAVGIGLGGSGTDQEAVMACLTFRKRAGCGSCTPCFQNQNPFNTLLSGADGTSVAYTPLCNATVRPSGTINTQCPASVVASASCSDATATVTWNSATFVDSCQGALLPACTAQHDGGANINGLISQGGEFPIGVSTICCEATSLCGETGSCCWTVTVELPDDADCDDGDECTVDWCEPNGSGAGSDGCVHDRIVHIYGDVFPPEGDGVVDIDDLVCVVVGISFIEKCPSGDISPCEGDGTIDTDDLLALFGIFLGEPLCPDRCPP